MTASTAGSATRSLLAPVALPGEVGTQPPARRRPEVWLIWAVWGAVGLGQLASSLGQTKEYTPIGRTETTASWVGPVTNACDALLLAVCAAAVVVGLLSDRRALRSPRRWALLSAMLAPWVLLVGHALATGSRVGPSVAPYPALVLAFWACAPRLAVVRTIGQQVVVTAAVSMLLAAVVPSAGLYVGGAGFQQEKPISGLGILAGFLPNGNILGGYLAMGLPSVLTLRRPAVRWTGLALTAFALVWSASRTAWAVAVVVLVALVVLRLVGPRLRGRVAAAGLAALTLVAVLLPYVVSSPKQFNHRARYWIYLRENWSARPWLGHGIDYFDRVAASVPQLGGYAYHAHNVAMQLLVTGGLLTLVAAAVPLGLAGVRAVRMAGAGHEWAVLFLAAVALTAAFEVPVSFADLVKVNLAALLPLIVLLTARTRTEDLR